MTDDLSGSALSAPPPGAPDTERLDFIEEWLDAFEWIEIGDPAGKHVRCDWFVGDGGGHWFTVAKTFREAVDAARMNMKGVVVPAPAPRTET